MNTMCYKLSTKGYKLSTPKDQEGHNRYNTRML